MTRKKSRHVKFDCLLTQARMTDISKEDLPKYYNALEVADKRAFPVNMAAAIETLSLNDAAMIGYLRGINDAAITLKRKRAIPMTEPKETDVVDYERLKEVAASTSFEASIHPFGSDCEEAKEMANDADLILSAISEITALRERVAELERHIVLNADGDFYFL